MAPRNHRRASPEARITAQPVRLHRSVRLSTGGVDASGRAWISGKPGGDPPAFGFLRQ